MLPRFGPVLMVLTDYLKPVAGMPFEEDLVGIEKSWKAAFEAAGIQVELEPGRLGLNPQIVEVFWRHMEAALDIIPQNGRVAQ